MSLSLDRCEIECAGEGDPLRLARALHRQLPDLTKAIPIEEIALALDIMAIEEHAFEGIEAALVTDQAKRVGSIGVKAGARSTRRRYSIAHELGHFLNDRHEPTAGGSFTCSLSDFLRPIGAARHVRQEREANTFAIEVLTPRDQLAPMLSPPAEIEYGLELANRYEVSSEAALRRYVELHAETLAVAFAREGRLRYSVRSESFPWIRLEPGDPIGETPLDTLRGERFTSMHEVDAESWLGARGGHLLYAQTLIQRDGFTATLLIREPPDDEGEEDGPRFR